MKFGLEPTAVTYRVSLWDNDEEMTPHKCVARFMGEYERENYLWAEVEEPFLNINIPNEAVNDRNRIRFSLKVHTIEDGGFENYLELNVSPVELFGEDAARDLWEGVKEAMGNAWGKRPEWDTN